MEAEAAPPLPPANERFSNWIYCTVHHNSGGGGGGVTEKLRKAGASRGSVCCARSPQSHCIQLTLHQSQHVMNPMCCGRLEAPCGTVRVYQELCSTVVTRCGESNILCVPRQAAQLLTSAGRSEPRPQLLVLGSPLLHFFTLSLETLNKVSAIAQHERMRGPDIPKVSVKISVEIIAIGRL